MDTNFTYPRLFDIDDTFNTSFEEEVKLDTFNNTNDITYNVTYDLANQKVFDNDSSTTTNNKTAISSNYDNSSTNNKIITSSNYCLTYIPPDLSIDFTKHPLHHNNSKEHQENCLDLLDYEYMDQSSEVDDQEQTYNLNYEPYRFDSILNTDKYDDSMPVTPNDVPPFEYIVREAHYTPFEGGMSRKYVSLNDVNSFVAKADCEKLHMHDHELLSSSDNDDSDDDQQWQYNKQKCIIKLKKSTSVTDALPSPYSWGFMKAPIKRKSMSNIYGATMKKKNVRRGSAPNIHLSHTTSLQSMSSLNSTSSLSSLANNFQEAMYVSDMSLNYSSHGEQQGDGDAPIKKGRNVDKACNHCKRSHLRCDEMRPCRRCVATGKTGCKDVQHKPRGRPKLNKNL